MPMRSIGRLLHAAGAINVKRFLFVCIENAGRSQMAEAFARFYGKDQIEAYSAGSQPSGQINPRAVELMKELGYDLTKHKSKSLQEIPDIEYDAVVTMGCGDACPFVTAKRHLDWNIPDPKNMPLEEIRKIRDLIGRNVKRLLAD